MQKLLLTILSFIAKPFAGRGIDKRFPWLVAMYSNLYARLQKNEIVTVDLSPSTQVDAKLKVYANDSFIGMFLLTKGEFEPMETKLFLEKIACKTNDPNLVIVDIGANFGYYTVLAGVGAPAARIFAFEPDRDNYEVLIENVRLNRLQVQTEKLAVADVVGEMSFFSNYIHRGKSGLVFSRPAVDLPATQQNNRNATQKISYKVSVVTLDGYCVANNIDFINLLKIDAEGAELKILQGGERVLRSSPKGSVVFIEYNPDSAKESEYDPKELLHLLQSYGYTATKIIDETRKQIIDFSDKTLLSTLNHATFTNLLCEKR